MKIFFKKKGQGDISFVVILILFVVLLVIMIVISLYSSLTVVKTTADIESIAQGDTMLFAMLESGICAPVSGTPFKYILGTGLSHAQIIPGEFVVTCDVPDEVAVNYGGVTETASVSNCVNNFLKSVKAEKYSFSITYENTLCYRTVSEGYDENKPKKTEKIYISVPDEGSRVAEVVLSANFAARGDEACPEKDGTHSCAPRIYCLLEKGNCDEKYMCSASCCCVK